MEQEKKVKSGLPVLNIAQLKNFVNLRGKEKYSRGFEIKVKRWLSLR